MLQKGPFIKQNQKSFDLPLACPPTGGSGIKKNSDLRLGRCSTLHSPRLV